MNKEREKACCSSTYHNLIRALFTLPSTFFLPDKQTFHVENTELASKKYG